jgi:hypothetical protein
MSERIAAQRALAGRSAAGSRAFIQATLDWLAAHIAVIDGKGEIIMTNGAWVQFALDNGGRPTGAGENYLAVCDAAGEGGGPADTRAPSRARGGLRPGPLHRQTGPDQRRGSREPHLMMENS